MAFLKTVHTNVLKSIYFNQRLWKLFLNEVIHVIRILFNTLRFLKILSMFPVCLVIFFYNTFPCGVAFFMYTMRTDWHESRTRDITYVRKVFFVANTVDEMNYFTRSAGACLCNPYSGKDEWFGKQKAPKGEIFK